MTISELTLKSRDEEPVRRLEIFTDSGRRRGGPVVALAVYAAIRERKALDGLTLRQKDARDKATRMP